MKKKTVPWLLPLVAAMFLVASSDLSALSAKEEKDLTKLEQTLAKKGKLSKSEQQKYDRLTAAKAAESRQAVPLAEDLGEAAVVQVSPTVIDPIQETATVGFDGYVAEGVSASSTANSLGLVQKADTETTTSSANNSVAVNSAKDDPKTVVPLPDYPEWVANPYMLERLIKEAIRDNNIDASAEGEDASREFSLKDVYVGIGSATNAADSQAIQIAEARARQDLAFQQQSLVKAEITDYSKNTTSTKGGKTNDAEDYVVAQQSVNMELTPVKVQIREKIKGAWWVVVTAAKIPEQRPVVEEGPYIPSAFEAVRLMDERLERNRLKTTTASPAASEGNVQR